MKKNIEITGEIADVTASYVGIRLHICSFEGITDFFAVDTKEKEIITRLNATTKILLKIEHTYEDYMQLIKDLGLELSESYKRHWTPKNNERYMFISSWGEFSDDIIPKGGYHWLDTKRAANYNMFPTKYLVKKAVNLSKLGRLILLWQYSNDCTFVPDWRVEEQSKHYIVYDHEDGSIGVLSNTLFQEDTMYFETVRQAHAFIEIYETEIKEIMGEGLSNG